MSIPFLIILPILAAAPFLTRQIFHDAYLEEASQIAVDNAAILLGRRDRETFQFLSASNRMLRYLELVHHPLHICARVPSTAAACADKDVLLEAQIRAFHANVHRIARTMWMGSPRLALAEASRLQIGVGFSLRGDLPVTPRHCPFCRLPVQWESDRARIETRVWDKVRPGSSTVERLVGKSLRSSESWNYRLEDG